MAYRMACLVKKLAGSVKPGQWAEAIIDGRTDRRNTMEMLSSLWSTVDLRRDVLLILTPLFVATLAVEWLAMRNRGVYRLKDSLASIGLGSLYLVVRSEEHTSELQSRENLVC